MSQAICPFEIIWPAGINWPYVHSRSCNPVNIGNSPTRGYMAICRYEVIRRWGSKRLYDLREEIGHMPIRGYMTPGKKYAIWTEIGHMSIRDYMAPG